MSDLPKSPEYAKWLARRVREKGYEMTPDEVIASRNESYRKIRAAMLEKGIPVPESDAALRDMLRIALLGKPNDLD